MPIKKPKKEFGETFSTVSSSTKREVNDLRNEFNSFKSYSLERHNSIETKVSLLQNDVNILKKKLDFIIDKISKQELKSDSPNSTTNFEDRFISAMSLQSQIFKEEMKNISLNFLETLKASLEIESKSFEQKLIAQSKEFDKKLINAMKIRSNLAQNVSDEKNYENNSKDSNNGKEE